MKNIKFTTPSGIQLSYDNVRDLQVEDVTAYKIVVQWHDLSKTSYNLSFTEISAEIQKILSNKNIVTFSVERI